ncbi:MAG: AsmA family protein [candidate division WOR-3 bacterium]
MKKLLKILGIILGIIVLLIVIGYIAIRSFLTPAYLKNLVARMASEAINYPVDVGNVALKLGFKISIGIEDLSLKNPPGFSDRKMVEIKEVRLNLRLFPLFRRQVVVNSITIDGAKFNIERNKDNYYNITIPRLQKFEGPDFRIVIDRIDIERTSLSYEDAITNTTFNIQDIKQQITIAKNLLTISGQQTMEAKSKTLPVVALKINNTLEYDTLTRNIDLKELKIVYDPIEVQVSGTIEKAELLNLNAHLLIPEIAKLRELFPQKVKIERLSGSIRAEAKILGNTKEPKINGQCELVNITIKLPELKQPIQKINGSFSFDLNSIKNIIIQGLIGNSRFDITGSINDLKKPLLDLIVKSALNLRDIENLSDQSAGMKLSGDVSLNIALKGSIEKITYFGEYAITDATIDGIGLAKPITNFRVKGTVQNDGAKITECSGHIGRSDFSLNGYVSNFQHPIIQINNSSNLIDLDELFPKTRQEKKAEQKGIPVTIQGNVKINRLTGMDMEFKNINTTIKYENGIIDLRNCSAETFDGKVQFDFYYNINSPEPYRIHSLMENINVQKILKRFLKFENLTGRLTGVNNFSGMGFQQKQVIANLSASGNVKLLNGAFNNFEFLNRLCEWLGFKERRTINFNDLVLSYKIENGRAHIEDWSMATDIGNFLVDGYIKLDGDIRLNLTLTLNKRESDLLKNYHADWLLSYDPQGRATLDILATGKLFSPQFRLDTDKIKERLKGKIKEEYDKKKKELEKKLRDLFKK